MAMHSFVLARSIAAAQPLRGVKGKRSKTNIPSSAIQELEGRSCDTRDPLPVQLTSVANLLRICVQ